MGTTAHVAVLGGPRGLEHDAAATICELERRWTRFDPGSELSRLNGAARGRPTLVSPETYRLVERAVEAWRLTAGRYDPTVLEAVIDSGYDRTFTEIRPDRRGTGDETLHPAPGCEGIELDDRLHAVTLPPGVGIDPGGIGKGFAADLVAALVVSQGADGVLVDIGGDIRVMGDGPEDGRWVVDVEDPRNADRPLLHLALSDAGIATSSRLRRRWLVDGAERHHLIDPATGRPTVTPLVAATVIAGEAWWAEALTKAVFVAGTLDAAAGASVVTVDETGARRATDDLMELIS